MYTNTSILPTEELLEQRFYQTDLGKLYRAVPFDQLAVLLPKTKREQSGKGCAPWLTTQGTIALLLLKHYLCLSDALLIARLNTDWAMQRFCGLHLKAGEYIRDMDLPGRCRRRIASGLDIDKWQLQLAAAWKGDLNHTHLGLTDATCYESYITYPTDAKLIWKCCVQAFELVAFLRKRAKLRRSRANQDKHRAAYLAFARLKKKTHKKNKKLCRSLLKYLDRLLCQIAELRKKYPDIKVKNHQHYVLITIEQAKQQQWLHYFGKQGRVPDRIVSLHKPYVRAIVRGKENKPVEFGAKVNKVWVDGVCFIEHLSFKAFHEGIRFQSSTELQRRYFGDCSQMGADAIYATNENRTYCKIKGIATCFVAKGKQGREAEQKSQMRKVLGVLRGTRLEGSFGREKQYYLLDRIRASSEAGEAAWIFLGYLAANAVTIAKRRAGSKSRNKAA